MIICLKAPSEEFFAQWKYQCQPKVPYNGAHTKSKIQSLQKSSLYR